MHDGRWDMWDTGCGSSAGALDLDGCNDVTGRCSKCADAPPRRAPTESGRLTAGALAASHRLRKLPQPS
jgi:hypothetical protein